MKIMMNLLTTGTTAVALILSACSSTSSSTSTSTPVSRNPKTSTHEVKPYLKDTCLVTGEKLGSMGAPVSIVHQGQEVKFCCKPCISKFNASPAKYLGSL